MEYLHTRYIPKPFMQIHRYGIRRMRTNISLLFQVFGVGIPNPFRLRPFIGARVPVNSSFSPLIHIHNPYSEPLQVIKAITKVKFVLFRFVFIMYKIKSV